MADEDTATATATKPKAAAKSSVVDRFVRATGVPKSDVIGHNEEAGTVVTKQGSKFKTRGSKFMKLLGPDVATAEDEEDEDEE